MVEIVGVGSQYATHNTTYETSINSTMPNAEGQCREKASMNNRANEREKKEEKERRRRRARAGERKKS